MSQSVIVDTMVLVGDLLSREPDEPAPAPDPGDDHLWRLLSTVPGSILITGDQLLLQNPPGNASVLSPRSYFELKRWNE